MSEKQDCSNCTNQLTGFDGGFFGLPMTCECKVYGETENRKNCSEYEKRLTKSDLLMRIYELEKENEQLRNKLEVANARSGYYQRMLEKWCVKDE